MVAPHRRVEAPVLARRRELLRYLECSFPEALEGSGSPSQPQLAADPALTAFAQLGALRLGAKSCLISLLSRERQYVIAESTQSVSLRDCSIHKPDGALMFGVRSFTLDVSFCAWTLAHALQEEDSDMSSLDFYTQPEAADVFVVKDLSQDERFKDFDIVKGSPHLRFYAGVPLISPQTGRGIGSLCVLDDQARQGVDPIDVTALKDIAATVMDHLEHARATLERGRSDKMVYLAAKTSPCKCLFATGPWNRGVRRGRELHQRLVGTHSPSYKQIHPPSQGYCRLLCQFHQRRSRSDNGI